MDFTDCLVEISDKFAGKKELVGLDGDFNHVSIKAREDLGVPGSLWHLVSVVIALLAFGETSAIGVSISSCGVRLGVSLSIGIFGVSLVNVPSEIIITE